jgi:hypothetical protein
MRNQNLGNCGVSALRIPTALLTLTLLSGHGIYAMDAAEIWRQGQILSEENLLEEMRTPWPVQGALLVEAYFPFSGRQNPWVQEIPTTLQNPDQSLWSPQNQQESQQWDGYRQSQRLQFRAGALVKDLRFEFSALWSRVSWSIDDGMWSLPHPGADVHQAQLGIGLGSVERDLGLRFGASYHGAFEKELWKPWLAVRMGRLAGSALADFSSESGESYGPLQLPKSVWSGRFEGEIWARSRNQVWVNNGLQLPTFEIAGRGDTVRHLSLEYGLPMEPKGHWYPRALWFPQQDAYGGSILMAADPSRMITFEAGMVRDAQEEWHPLLDLHLGALGFHASRVQGWRGSENRSWTWGIEFQSTVLDEGSVLRVLSRRPKPAEEVK